MIYSGAVAILAQGISKHLLSGIDHHHHHHHYHHHQHHYRHHHHHHHRVVHNDMLIRCSDESLTLSTIVSQLQIHPKTAQKSSKIFPKRCKNIQKSFKNQSEKEKHRRNICEPEALKCFCAVPAQLHPKTVK